MDRAKGPEPHLDELMAAELAAKSGMAVAFGAGASLGELTVRTLPDYSAAIYAGDRLIVVFQDPTKMRDIAASLLGAANRIEQARTEYGEHAERSDGE